MEQHAVPRQITTFEFKLIGFFTIKQFIYLLLFTGITLVVYYLIPVPIMNFLFAGMVAVLGLGLTFYKHNERPLDVWIKNLFLSLLAPSQYYFHKDNPVPDFLKDLYLTLNPAFIQSHIDASQKLQNYIGPRLDSTEAQQKQNITSLIHSTQTYTPVASDGHVLPSEAPQQTPTSAATATPATMAVPATNQVEQPKKTSGKKSPFLSGIIKNSKNDPLPDVMIYLNSEAGQTIRILKTNHNGIFATFHPLEKGGYSLNPKDLGAKYFFDTMNLTVDESPIQPIDIYSKEIL